MSRSVFSKIISEEIPCYKIYENNFVFAFLSKDAIQLGHTLVVPKVEVDYFIDVTEPYYSEIFRAAKALARAIHEATGCKRVGTVIAGWDVPHFHYHLVPMFDYYDLDPKQAKERSHQENLNVQEKLVSKIGNMTSEDPYVMRAMVVEESLEDVAIVSGLKITKLEVSPESRWHIYSANVEAREIALIQRNLRQGPWYAHFWSGDKLIVAFRDKLFEMRRTNKETWAPAIEFGKKLGIPEAQLDFLTWE
jgi:histidine triad (HIT) family protein